MGLHHQLYLGTCLDQFSILIHDQIGDLTQYVGKDGEGHHHADTREHHLQTAYMPISQLNALTHRKSCIILLMYINNMSVMSKALLYDCVSRHLFGHAVATNGLSLDVDQWSTKSECHRGSYHCLNDRRLCQDAFLDLLLSTRVTGAKPMQNGSLVMAGHQKRHCEVWITSSMLLGCMLPT